VRNHLRLAGPEVPILDARRNGGIFNSVLRCPLQRRSRRWIFALTGADFVDDGVRNQDCGNEALD
jgi:hypothetical protein